MFEISATKNSWNNQDGSEGVSLKKKQPSDEGVSLIKKDATSQEEPSEGVSLRKKVPEEGKSLKKNTSQAQANETTPLEVTIYKNQNTYLPGFSKIALIKSTNQASLKFKLLDNKESLVLEAPLVAYGKYPLWSGEDVFYYADFSAINTEGKYQLQIEGKNGLLVKTKISISQEKFEDSLYKAYRYFYLERCGPNELHGDVFTDDAVDEKTGKKVDATGGWFDAGDFNKYIYTQWQPIWALLDLYQDKESKGPKENYLEEAKWGINFLGKMVKEDGSMYSAVYGEMGSVNKSPLLDKQAKRKLTAAQWGDPTWAVAYASAVFARMANFSQDKEKNLALAIKTNQYFRNKYDFDHIERGEDFQGLGGIVLSDLYLWKITGKEEYLSDAKKAIQIILAHQNTDYGFFFTDKNKEEPQENSYGQYVAYSFLEGLKFFVDLFPKDDLSGDIKTAITTLAQKHLLKLGSNTPYLQEQWLDRFDRKPSNDIYTENFDQGGKGDGTNAYFLSAANAAMVAYQLSPNPAYKTFAINQMNWIFGINPVGYSFMTDVGEINLKAYHNRLQSLPNVPGGKIEGAIVNGIAPYPKWPYYVFDLSGNDWKTSEPWLPINAWYLMLAVKMNNYFSDTAATPTLPKESEEISASSSAKKIAKNVVPIPQFTLKKVEKIKEKENGDVEVEITFGVKGVSDKVSRLVGIILTTGEWPQGGAQISPSTKTVTLNASLYKYNKLSGFIIRGYDKDGQFLFETPKEDSFVIKKPD